MSYFTIKLMDIDSEHLGIPDTEYKCVVTMPANEFQVFAGLLVQPPFALSPATFSLPAMFSQRIVREISIIGDTVKISASKEGVKFR